MLTFVDMTTQLGPFTPAVLIYFAHLQELNISGCVTIDPCLFTECVGACVELKKLSMKSCVQFTQYLVKISRQVQNIEYLHCTGSCEITCVNAFCILSNLPRIMFVNFSPNITNNLIDWKQLVIRFNSVQFGIELMGKFPFNGARLRYDDIYDNEMQINSEKKLLMDVYK